VIPLLDLRDFQAGDERQARFVRATGDALSRVGFLTLVHHGIEPGLIREAYRLVERFFTLPEAVKRRYEVPGLKGQRGFTSFGREHARNSTSADLKEFWHVGRQVEPGRAAAVGYPVNVWPAEVSGFRETLSELYARLDGCAQTLLRATSLYLGEPPERLAEMAVEGNSILRLIHYPPVEEERDPSALRAAPHEDINLITLLCESTGSGLEIQTREGEWLPVSAGEGEIVVDAGDMLQNVTNGVLRSTTHRVVNPESSRERRLSMPFFVHPRPEVSLSPLESCVRLVGERHHPDLTAGEYLEQRLREIGLG